MNIVADMKKSGEKVDIDHALIRGLRRGITIYTNEVGFSCYRRQVQMLDACPVGTFGGRIF